MNPHSHPPKIKSVAMDQLPTPRTDLAQRELCQRSKIDSDLPNNWNHVVKAEFARTLERELLATQARLRVLRSALETLADAVGNSRVPQNTMQAALQIHVTLGPALEGARAALNHP